MKNIFDLLSVFTLGIGWALYLNMQDGHRQMLGKEDYILSYKQQFEGRVAVSIPLAERLFVCIVAAIAIYLLFLFISFVYARTYEAFSGKSTSPLE